MSENKFDQKMKENLKKNETEIPKKVQMRIDETLNSLPERKKTRFIKKGVASVVAAVASATFVFGVGYHNEAMADVLKKVPFIDSVFKLSNETTLKEVKNKNMATNVEKSATDKEMTVQIKEVIYDGSRISIGYVIHSEKGLDGNNNPFIDYRVDGKKLSNYGAGGSVFRYDANTFMGVMHLDTAKKLPERFELEMHFTKIGRKEGNWKLSFPVRENNSENKTILVNKTKISGERKVTVEKMTLAPTSTEVIMELEQPSDKEMELSFELKNDKGEKLDIMALSGLGDGRYKVIYEPLDKETSYFTLTPKSRNDADTDKMLKKLGMKIEFR